MKTFAYLRVSTEDQNHGVDAQRAAIEKAEHVDEWVEEKASGKNMRDRPEFTALIDRVCADGGTLVVAKLDRLGRSTLDVLSVFDRVSSCGGNIKVLDLGLDTRTPIGKFMLTILSGFAELEREMISQRTKDGLAAAAAKGVKLGRPKTWDETVILAHTSFMTDSEVAEHVGCSTKTVTRVRKKFASQVASG